MLLVLLQRSGYDVPWCGKVGQTDPWVCRIWLSLQLTAEWALRQKCSAGIVCVVTEASSVCRRLLSPGAYGRSNRPW